MATKGKEEGKIEKLCQKEGCPFAGHISGYCSAHSTTTLDSLNATEKERQKKSDIAISHYDRKQLLERYQIKFSPFLMNDAHFQQLLREMKEQRPTPQILYQKFRKNKWILTHVQAHALIETIPTYNEDNDDTVSRYEDAIFSRCFDRNKLKFRGREGYYHDEFDGFKSDFLKNAYKQDVNQLFTVFTELDGPQEWND
jgi:hypothetical protein